LIKAGLLPQLGADVLPVYLEATGGDTEKRLLNGLRQRLPNLKEHNLVSAMSAIRQGHLLATNRKIVIFIDQFEQWLHAHADGGSHELPDAIRQCDGENVQCVLMIRDDFWLAASRLMRDLEIELVEGRNMAMVDLFDKSYARNVLTAFGRAFGQLPQDVPRLSKAEEQFIQLAVDGLADEGKVISVRLALFAEMVKSKPWTPKTMRDLGGTLGVGATFLEETFTAANAPPEHRIYAKPARKVLAALLPEQGANIKGQMKSFEELKVTSGYADRSRDFERLLAILDTDLRLISPTAPDGIHGEEAVADESARGKPSRLSPQTTRQVPRNATFS
jgi:hypothetical protein